MVRGVLRSLGTILLPWVAGVIVLSGLLLIGTPAFIAVPLALGITTVVVVVMVQRFVPELGPYVVIGIALLLVVIVWVGGGIFFWRGY